MSVGAVIGRILRSVDFERVLGSPARARSAHFAVHYVAGRPSLPAKPRSHTLITDLSTEPAPQECLAVDKSAAEGCWLGTVVPKRHAKRAATRNLIKRQIRHAVSESGLVNGLWVVRLRQAFDAKIFVSAASLDLKKSASHELAGLLADAARGMSR